ncbi:MAG TPA: hypothetical protein VNP90_04900, partial [Actinomycetota bacterium]|nr:hypothetical protein [Actinomycetota bacterium]
MVTTPPTSSVLPPAALLGDPGRRRREARVRAIFAAAAGISIAVSLAIVIALVGQAIGFLGKVDLSALWTDGWFPRRGRFDVVTIFTGSVLVSLVAMAVATPLGLGAAMYLS